MVHDNLTVIHDIANTPDYFKVLLVYLEHFFSPLLIRLAKYLHLKRYLIYVDKMLFDGFDAKRKNNLPIHSCDLFHRIVF